MQKFDLSQLFGYYMRRLWVIILIAVLGAAAGWTYSTFMVQPKYESTSTVILDQSKRSTDTTPINNYMTLLKSRKVLEPIIVENALDVDYSTLMQDITVVNEKSTEIITISVVASDPEMAQTINTELINSFNLESLGLAETDKESGDNKEEENVEDGSIIKVIDLASFNDTAINIETTKSMMLAGGGAAVATMAIMLFVYDYRQSRRQTRMQYLARRRSPVVGKITTTQATGEMTEQPGGNKIALIDQEARDILDVLENIDGITPKPKFR